MKAPGGEATVGEGLGVEALGSEAARRRLPELLERARRGEPTVIQKHGVAVAALVPLQQMP
ncbi:MAG: type II toxin-antitoxin system prevent-host-death family antitoxin, partial [Cyanobacteriota bacterium]|nr:type II toxin-antitoxin system prevent-host-death family antitoxin [Cyanobacteriota bacterium]